MMPVAATYAGLALPSPYAPSPSGYADELLRRLQGAQSLDEGRQHCAEMRLALSLSVFDGVLGSRMTQFHQEHSQWGP